MKETGRSMGGWLWESPFWEETFELRSEWQAGASHLRISRARVIGRGNSKREGSEAGRSLLYFRNRKKVCVARTKSRRKLEGRPGPGQVGSCVPYKQSWFILTGVKTQRRVLSRGTMRSDSHFKASLLLPWGLSVTGRQQSNQNSWEGFSVR